MKQSGFSLLEVMIVVTIIAAIVTMVVPRISNENNKLKAEVRRLSTLSKQLHATAKLKNQTYRLVIDMGEENEPGLHSYWVESSSKEILLDENSSIGLSASEDEEAEDDNTPRSAFTKATDVMKKPRELPQMLRFEDVEVVSRDNPITQGLAYIHFFPQGLVEEAVIHLKTESDHNWSLAVHPLTGRMDITTNYISLKEVREQ